MAIKISTYRIQVDAVAKGVQRTFQNIRKQAEGLQSRLKSALSFGVGNFLSIKTFTQDIARLGAALIGLDQRDELDEIAKTSSKLGVAADQFQIYRKAAEFAGVENANFDNSLRTILKRADEAASGLAAPAEAFGRLGIDPDAFKALDLRGQFSALEAGFARIENNAERVRIASDLAGRSGSDLLNIFSGSAVNQAERLFESIGGALGSSDLAQVEAANDSINSLFTTFEAFQQRLLVGFAPALTATAAAAQEFVAQFRIDPAAVTDVIISAVAAAENFLGTLGSISEVTQFFGSASGFAFDVFRRGQQGVLLGLSLITQGYEEILRLAAAAANATGLSDTADFLTRQADSAESFVDSFRQQADSIGDAINAAEPEIQEGGLADRIRQAVEDARTGVDLDISNRIDAGDLPGAASSVRDAAQALKDAALPSALARGSAGAVSLLNQQSVDVNLRPLEREQKTANKTLKAIDQKLADNTTSANQTTNVNVTLVCT